MSPGYDAFPPMHSITNYIRDDATQFWLRDLAAFSLPCDPARWLLTCDVS